MVKRGIEKCPFWRYSRRHDSSLRRSWKASCCVENRADPLHSLKPLAFRAEHGPNMTAGRSHVETQVCMAGLFCLSDCAGQALHPVLECSHVSKLRFC